MKSVAQFLLPITVLIGAVLSGLGSAHAQSVRSFTADQLEDVLDNAGLGAEMAEDADTGTPVAQAYLGETLFFVRALDCLGTPDACSTLLFFANFDLGRQATINDLAIVNRFNEKQVFGRAYLIEEENQVGVDYVIELDGGVDMDNVSANISRWADVVAAFVEHLQEGNRTSGS